jgi:hypothetical protein
MGVWQTNGPLQGPVVENPAKDLINFGGKGIYRAPEFVWNQTVGPFSPSTPVHQKVHSV